MSPRLDSVVMNSSNNLTCRRRSTKMSRSRRRPLSSLFILMVCRHHHHHHHYHHSHLHPYLHLHPRPHPHCLGTRSEILEAARDALSNRLDKLEGATITDQKIFREHAARYEKEFLEDMATLHVREPDVMTRVSEYVKQIEDFVTEIIAKGAMG